MIRKTLYLTVLMGLILSACGGATATTEASATIVPSREATATIASSREVTTTPNPIVNPAGCTDSATF